MTDTLPSSALPGRQPFLHELVTCLAAPVLALSDADGDIRPAGAQGVYAADLRVLSRSELTVDGHRPEPARYAMHGAATAEFVGLVRSLGNPGADPTVWVRRRRTVSPTGCRESLTLVNRADHPIATVLDLALAADLAPIESVKQGLRTPSVRLTGTAGSAVTAASGPTSVTIDAPGAAVRSDGDTALLQWSVEVAPRSEQTVGFELTAGDPAAVVVAARNLTLPAPEILAADLRLQPLVDRSVADLNALLMATAAHPDDAFLGAGSPWYLTLFGRDSLWGARMTLPLGTALAYGTLRSLASLQGTRVDIDTAEEPGKIPHEVRRAAAAHSDSFLPPVYYGTIDATPLWICLLADAWRWGMPEAQVRELLPALDRALGWLRDFGDSDGDGFLEYIDRSGHGLANQGWKDSGDSVRFADGRIAEGPIALAEVQGYAYEAAVKAADLLDALRGGDEGAVWRRWAADLAARFRQAFWVTDEFGPYPAMALDADKTPVDACASNMGHLLGTGLLTPDEARAVADRLLSPSMASGFGLRTMSATAGGYSPLSYHCGTVWPHDTAIAVLGLVDAGFVDHAVRLADGLLTASTAFDQRFPELFAGFGIDDLSVPVPYPASCRPQAWSAAGALVIVQAFLGLRPDVPGGRLRISPAAAAGAIDVRGLRIAGEPFDVAADGRGGVTVGRIAAALTVDDRP